jgi:hypothetical protein
MQLSGDAAPAFRDTCAIAKLSRLSRVVQRASTVELMFSSLMRALCPTLAPWERRATRHGKLPLT